MSGIINTLKKAASSGGGSYQRNAGVPEFSPEMRFSIEPLPGDSGFSQWHSAMKMVSQLPEGIPPEFRRRLWLSLADKHLFSKGIDWATVERNCFSEWSHPADAELGVQIVKDLHRTGCSLFCGKDGQENQALLKKVLLAYARWNKAVGYCQGFNMLAALILQVTEKCEADALKLMIYLIEGVLPDSYFADSLRGLSVDMAVFRELLRTKLPRLSKHLDTLQIASKEGTTSYEPPLTNVFTMQWFLTLFCNCLPQPTVLRVWDLILLEGNEILLRTALAIWQVLGDRIMTAKTADEFYCVMGMLMREILEFDLIDANTLIKGIVTIGPLTELHTLREHYLYNINPWGTSAPANPDKRLKVYHKDRLVLDIGVLKKQYTKLKQRQRQAHIIFNTAVARQTSRPAPVAMNHLLLGKSALVPAKRLGPPKGAVPPARMPPPKPKTTQPVKTLLWKDTTSRHDSSSSSTSSSDTELCDDHEASSDEDEAKCQLPDDNLIEPSDTKITTEDNTLKQKQNSASVVSDLMDFETKIETDNQIAIKSDIFDNTDNSDLYELGGLQRSDSTVSEDGFDFEKFLEERVKSFKEKTYSSEESIDDTSEQERLKYARRNSVRALEIIQENSLILHRILQCQSRMTPTPPPTEEDEDILNTNSEENSLNLQIPDLIPRDDEDEQTPTNEFLSERAVDEQEVSRSESLEGLISKYSKISKSTQEKTEEIEELVNKYSAASQKSDDIEDVEDIINKYSKDNSTGLNNAKEEHSKTPLSLKDLDADIEEVDYNLEKYRQKLGSPITEETNFSHEVAKTANCKESKNESNVFKNKKSLYKIDDLKSERTAEDIQTEIVTPVSVESRVKGEGKTNESQENLAITLLDINKENTENKSSVITQEEYEKFKAKLLEESSQNIKKIIEERKNKKVKYPSNSTEKINEKQKLTDENITNEQQKHIEETKTNEQQKHIGKTKTHKQQKRNEELNTNEKQKLTEIIQQQKMTEESKTIDQQKLTEESASSIINEETQMIKIRDAIIEEQTDKKDNYLYRDAMKTNEDQISLSFKNMENKNDINNSKDLSTDEAEMNQEEINIVGDNDNNEEILKHAQNFQKNIDGCKEILDKEVQKGDIDQNKAENIVEAKTKSNINKDFAILQKNVLELNKSLNYPFDEIKQFHSRDNSSIDESKLLTSEDDQIKHNFSDESKTTDLYQSDFELSPNNLSAKENRSGLVLENLVKYKFGEFDDDYPSEVFMDKLESPKSVKDFSECRRPSLPVVKEEMEESAGVKTNVGKQNEKINDDNLVAIKRGTTFDSREKVDEKQFENCKLISSDVRKDSTNAYSFDFLEDLCMNEFSKISPVTSPTENPVTSTENPVTSPTENLVTSPTKKSSEDRKNPQQEEKLKEFDCNDRNSVNASNNEKLEEYKHEDKSIINDQDSSSCKEENKKKSKKSNLEDSMKATRDSSSDEEIKTVKDVYGNSKRLGSRSVDFKNNFEESVRHKKDSSSDEEVKTLKDYARRRKDSSSDEEFKGLKNLDYPRRRRDSSSDEETKKKRKDYTGVKEYEERIPSPIDIFKTSTSKYKYEGESPAEFDYKDSDDLLKCTSFNMDQFYSFEEKNVGDEDEPLSTNLEKGFSVDDSSITERVETFSQESNVTKLKIHIEDCEKRLSFDDRQLMRVEDKMFIVEDKEKLVKKYSDEGLRYSSEACPLKRDVDGETNDRQFMRVEDKMFIVEDKEKLVKKYSDEGLRYSSEACLLKRDVDDETYDRQFMRVEDNIFIVEDKEKLEKKYSDEGLRYSSEACLLKRDVDDEALNKKEKIITVDDEKFHSFAITRRSKEGSFTDEKLDSIVDDEKFDSFAIRRRSKEGSFADEEGTESNGSDTYKRQSRFEEDGVSGDKHCEIEEKMKRIFDDRSPKDYSSKYVSSLDKYKSGFSFEARVDSELESSSLRTHNERLKKTLSLRIEDDKYGSSTNEDYLDSYKKTFSTRSNIYKDYSEIDENTETRDERYKSSNFDDYSLRQKKMYSLETEDKEKYKLSLHEDLSVTPKETTSSNFEDSTLRQNKMYSLGTEDKEKYKLSLHEDLSVTPKETTSSNFEDSSLRQNKMYSLGTEDKEKYKLSLNEDISVTPKEMTSSNFEDSLLRQNKMYSLGTEDKEKYKLSLHEDLSVTPKETTFSNFEDSLLRQNKMYSLGTEDKEKYKLSLNEDLSVTPKEMTSSNFEDSLLRQNKMYSLGTEDKEKYKLSLNEDLSVTPKEMTSSNFEDSLLRQNKMYSLGAEDKEKYKLSLNEDLSVTHTETTSSNFEDSSITQKKAYSPEMNDEKYSLSFHEYPSEMPKKTTSSNFEDSSVTQRKTYTSGMEGEKYKPSFHEDVSEAHKNTSAGTDNERYRSSLETLGKKSPTEKYLLHEDSSDRFPSDHSSKEHLPNPTRDKSPQKDLKPTTPEMIEISKNSKYTSILEYSRNLDERFNNLILKAPGPNLNYPYNTETTTPSTSNLLKSPKTSPKSPNKSPSHAYNPFPVNISSRQNKEVAVRLGLYKKS